MRFILDISEFAVQFGVHFEDQLCRISYKKKPPGEGHPLPDGSFFDLE